MRDAARRRTRRAPLDAGPARCCRRAGSASRGRRCRGSATPSATLTRRRSTRGSGARRPTQPRSSSMPCALRLRARRSPWRRLPAAGRARRPCRRSGGTPRRARACATADRRRRRRRRRRRSDVLGSARRPVAAGWSEVERDAGQVELERLVALVDGRGGAGLRRRRAASSSVGRVERRRLAPRRRGGIGWSRRAPPAARRAAVAGRRDRGRARRRRCRDASTSPHRRAEVRRRGMIDCGIVLAPSGSVTSPPSPRLSSGAPPGWYSGLSGSICAPSSCALAQSSPSPRVSA